jgi:hypothetical protein
METKFQLFSLLLNATGTFLIFYNSPLYSSFLFAPNLEEDDKQRCQKHNPMQKKDAFQWVFSHNPMQKNTTVVAKSRFKYISLCKKM